MCEPRISRQDLPRQPLGDGTVIFTTADGVCVLNATAVQVLELCDGTRTQAQVTRAFADRHPSEDARTATAQAAEALRIMLEHGLVKGVE